MITSPFTIDIRRIDRNYVEIKIDAMNTTIDCGFCHKEEWQAICNHLKDVIEELGGYDA